MTLSNCLVLSAMVFCLGLYGILTRRNIIGLLMSTELLMNAALINFIGFAYFQAGDFTAGPVFSIFIIAITSSEMAVALAIVVALHRQKRKLDIKDLHQLHG